MYYEFGPIVDFLLDPELTGWLLLLKTFFLLISLAMIGFIIFALLKTSWLDKYLIRDVQEFLTYRHYGLSETKKKWKEIEDHFEGGIESELKLAIVEANSLLDNVLRIMTYKGHNLGERLDKINTDILENLKEVKKAHQLYSDIVHDPTYRLTFKEAEKALNAYRDALVHLNAL